MSPAAPLSPVRRLLVALVIICSASGAEALYFLRGLSLHHINSVSAIPIYLLKLFQNSLLAGTILPITWTKTILTGVPLPGGMPSFDPFFIPLAFLFNLSNAIVAHDIVLRGVGGFGMYLFLRRMEISFPVALTTAAIFCANVYYAAFGQDPQFGATIFWVPWLALMLSRIMAHGGNKTLDVLLLGMVLALALLTTNIQSIYFLTLFVVMPLGLSRLHADGSTPPLPNRDWLLGITAIATGYLLFVVLAAFELIPAVDNLLASRRDIESPQRYILLAFVIAGAQWAVCRTLRRGGRVQLVLLAMSSVVLMGLGMWKMGVYPLPWRLVGLVGVEGMVFDSQPLPFLLSWLQLPLALLGLAAMRRGHPALPVVALALAFFIFPAMFKNYVYIQRASFVPVFGLLLLTACGLDEALRITARRWPRVKRLAPLLLVLLLAEHHGMIFANTLYSQALSQITRVSPETSFLEKEGGRVAWTYRSHDEVRQRLARADNPLMLEWLLAGYHGGRPFCFSGISVLPKRLGDFSKLAYPKYFGADAERPANNLLAVSGVRYVLSPWPLPEPESQGLLLSLKGESYYVYENTARLPRLRLVSSLAFLPENKIPAALADADRGALLDLAYTDDSTQPATADADKNRDVWATDETFQSDRGEVRLLEDQETRTRIVCAVNKESFLILADTFDPNWTARLNGQALPFIRVNGAFIGVRLPVGSSELVLEFAPLLWRTAMWVSVCAWAVALLALAGLLARLIVARSQEARAKRTL